MESLLNDLRFALRTLAKRPLISTVAVLCLALAIGSVTVAFSLVRGVLLRPLPYPEPDRVMLVFNQFHQLGLTRAPSSGNEYQDVREQNEVFAETGGIVFWFYNLSGVERAERLVGGRVTPSFFRVLGLETARGRTFTDEEAAQLAPLAILSHQLWQDRFGGQDEAIGRSISLDNVPYTIVGVMPAAPEPPIENVAIFVPWAPDLNFPRDRRGTTIVARLAPGVGRDRAQQDLDRIAQRFEKDFPETYPENVGYGLVAVPMTEEVVRDVRPQLLVLQAAVLLILLIACANVANLLLAQATARTKEIAIRSAFGAGRGQVIRQLLIESLLLAGLGGGAGILLAWWGTTAVVKVGRSAVPALNAVPRLELVGLDPWVLAFAVGVSLATGVLFGLVPALRASRPNLRSALQEGGKTSAAGGRRPLRQVLVVAEIALAVVVLIGAGLMIRSLRQLLRVDPGFRVDGIVTMQMYLQRSTYPQPQQRVDFYRRLTTGLTGIPGIDKIGVISQLPLTPVDFRGEVLVEGREVAPGSPNPAVGFRMVNPDYFDTVDVRLLRGRFFTESDHESAPPVALVDASLAARLWPDQSPLGQRLRLNTSFDAAGFREVVGVVSEVKQQGLAIESNEQVYVPYTQYPSPFLSLALRTARPASQVVDDVLQVLREIDPGQPVGSVFSGEELVAMSLSLPRFNQILFTSFGLLALFLSGLGVYGVMAYSVAQRQEEIGLRMALGARRSHILGLVLEKGLALAAIGIAVGLVGSLLAQRVWNRWLSTMVFGVSTVDLTTYLLVPVVLAVLAVAACLMPALRATRIDPLRALRRE